MYCWKKLLTDGWNWVATGCAFTIGDWGKTLHPLKLCYNETAGITKLLSCLCTYWNVLTAFSLIVYYFGSSLMTGSIHSQTCKCDNCLL